MLPTSFEKIPDVLINIMNLTGKIVRAEINSFGTVYFVTYDGEPLFYVFRNSDIFVDFYHWKRQLNK